MKVATACTATLAVIAANLALARGFVVSHHPVTATTSGRRGELVRRQAERRSLTLPPRFESQVNCPLDTPFIVDKRGEPTEAELSNENLIKIITERSTDEDTNTLAWKCLGYRTSESGEWQNSKVFPRWREKYPSPPDLLNVSRDYSRDSDVLVLKAVQALIRAIPMAYKQSLKEHLKPLGFTGFKVDELTPNRTRRAQVTNFILYYRECLNGKSLEELQAKKREWEESQQVQHKAYQDLTQ